MDAITDPQGVTIDREFTFLHHPRVTGRLYARLLPTLIDSTVTLAEPSSAQRTVASDVLLLGWLNVDDDTGRRWIPSQRLRDVLVRADNNVRTHTLWQVARWPGTTDKITFLAEVWPRQAVVKNPAVTRALCEVALHDEDHFPELLDAIIPLLSRPNGTNSSIPHFGDEARKILKRFPEWTIDTDNARMASSSTLRGWDALPAFID